jgi:hypothetical protein
MVAEDFNRTIDPFQWRPGLDAAPDFVPDEEYADLLTRVNVAYSDILTGDVLNFRKVELKAVVNQYRELFEEVETKLRYYEAYDKFFFLYDELISVFIFVEDRSWDAYFALDDYSKFDMSEEHNVINWLDAYRRLNSQITYDLNYNNDCDCHNESVYRISYLGIHIYKEDLAKIFEFSILYGEHYAHLLQKYMTISWEEYHAMTEEEAFHSRRDELYYYLNESKK